MAWTVAQNCSSIVTKRESTPRKDKTSTGQNSHCVNTKEERTGQESHCVNTVEEMHWVEITLCQYRQRRGHWAEITLCQHHGRHSRRRITKNVHSLCLSGGLAHFSLSPASPPRQRPHLCPSLFLTCASCVCPCVMVLIPEISRSVRFDVLISQYPRFFSSRSMAVSFCKAIVRISSRKM